MRLASIAATGALLATQLYAQQFSEFCPSSDICYRLNIPEETATSGSGDIFFQIAGPTSYSWIGWGQGQGMAGANIFVIYADGNGNVTLSPRSGEGHIEPEYNPSAQVTLLEGSGVSGNQMVANVRCSNCDTFSNMDFTSDSGSWIYASRPGGPINSAEPDAEIEQHAQHGSVVLNFANAKGGDDVNPFVTGDDNGGVSQAPVPAGSGGDDDDDEGGDVLSAEGGEDTPEIFVTAHGILAAVAFLVLFPSGAIFIRIPALSRFGGIWVHAAIQMIAYSTFIAAAGLGIYIAMNTNQLTETHPIIGMVLLGVLFTQPFAGLLHHHLFKKERRRTAVSFEHIFVGRGAILLGMVNGGLGLKLAEVNDMGYLVAYGIVAGVMGSVYLAAIIFGEVKRSRNLKASQWQGEPKMSS